MSAVDAVRTADKTADDMSAVQPGTADKTADDMYPTTDYRRPTTARAGDSTEADADYHVWVKARTAAKGGGPGLEAKIRAEDRHIFDEGQRQKAAVRALNECARCDSAGWPLGVDGDVIVPTLKCAHGPDPTPTEAEAILRAELGAEEVEQAS